MIKQTHPKTNLRVDFVSKDWKNKLCYGDNFDIILKRSAKRRSHLNRNDCFNNAQEEPRTMGLERVLAIIGALGTFSDWAMYFLHRRESRLELEPLRREKDKNKFVTYLAQEEGHINENTIFEEFDDDFQPDCIRQLLLELYDEDRAEPLKFYGD